MQAKVVATRWFRRTWKQLNPQTQKIVESKICQLAANPAHPSLQVHRLRQAKAENMWTCYISVNKRLVYQYSDGVICLWDVGEHAIVDRIHLRSFEPQY